MLSRILVVAALAVPMFAQYPYGRSRNDGYYGRDDGYYGRDDDYNRRDRGAYRNGGYNSGAVIDRTMRDLQSAASRSRVSGHDRNHFSRAMNELQQFTYKSQQGKFDTGKLDKVIEDLDHLSRADEVHPRDRQILGRDMQELRMFRSNRGGYNSGYGGYGGYGNGGYNRGGWPW
jgi:hypothetical protein